MIRTILTLTTLGFLAFGCTAPPRKELAAARIAMAKAQASGAPELAPARYQTAAEVLNNGEDLFARGQYRLAKETLPYAETLAQQSIHAAREEQLRRDREELLKQEKLAALKRQLEAEEQAKPRRPPQKKPTSRPVPAKPKPKPQLDTTEAVPPAAVAPAPGPPPATNYTVNHGETLWIIAAKKQVYGDAFLWPLLYRANRDQIKDPQQIYAGQTLSIPRNLNDRDLEEARATARKSDIFPLDLLMKATPGPEP